MEKIIYLTFILLSTLLTIASGNDSFILESIDEAKQLSARTNQPILIIFGSPECVFCESLKKDILSFKLSPDIDPYIICYLDLNKDPTLKKDFNIKIIPDSRIIINNEQRTQIKGYSKNNYIKWLNNAK